MFNTTNTSSQQPRRRLLKLVVAVILVAMALASSVAHGADTASQGPSPQPAEVVDVAVVSYASDYSVTQQEAKRRLDRIQPLQGILAEIRVHETARLAGWGIDHTGTFTGWVWLTGDDAPSSAASDIAAAHSDVEIRTGAVHSLAALLDAQEGLFENLHDLGPVGRVNDGPENIAEIERITTFTSINMRGNALEIGIDPALANNAPTSPLDHPVLTEVGPVGVTDEALQAKIKQVTHQLKDHINVKYNIIDGRGLSAEASFSAGTQIGGCTIGFAARKNNSGAYGIITAGHCGDDGPNDNMSLTVNGVSLPHDFGWLSVNADAQFHTIPTGYGHVLTDDYLCHSLRPINYCDVTGTETRNRMMEDYVCHAGMSSGVSCGAVTAISVRLGSGNCRTARDQVVVCNRVFVAVGPNNSVRSCDGDSGGPWYRNGIAYGIHFGGTSELDSDSSREDKCRESGITAVFSAIDEVMRFLDVRVITDGNVTIQ